METLFLTVARMSMAGAVSILIVLAVRLLLRRAPKVYSYALWAVVLLRLLCPLSLESAHSPIPSARTASVRGEGQSALRIPTVLSSSDAMADGAPAETPHRPSSPPAGVPAAPEAPSSFDYLALAWRVWLCGTVLLLAHSLLSLLRLRRRLVGAVPLAGEADVLLADHIPSPLAYYV